MSLDQASNAKNGTSADQKKPWYDGLTGYHWFVLAVASLGWLFDTMDQQLFNLARKPAIQELLGEGASQTLVDVWAPWMTSIFIVGWATGGIIFGILGDKIGRAKTMLFTILVYSLCTGLNAFSQTIWDFAFFRFLTGLGVGGEFAVGVALVAEVMPEHARARALGLLQALSAVGNMTAAMIGITLGLSEDTGVSSWRIMFIIGTLPAFLAIVIRARLKEPERWQNISHESSPEQGEVLESAKNETGETKSTTKSLGSIQELFGTPRWRKNTIIGMLLAFSGVVGLWGIGFFSFDLIRNIFRSSAIEMAVAEGYGEEQVPLFDEQISNGTLQVVAKKEQIPDPLPEGTDYIVAWSEDDAKLEFIARDDEVKSYVGRKLTLWTGLTSLVQNLGAFLGIYSFSLITGVIGRRLSFLIAFILALISTAFTFFFLGRITGFWDIYWMIPIMGFCQLSLFGGYAIYFPELFPTRLRSTGTSFCYNVGRLVAATGPVALGVLNGVVYADFAEIDGALPYRYSGVTMCAAFLIGIIVLPFAPETKDQPLPE